MIIGEKEELTLQSHKQQTHSGYNEPKNSRTNFPHTRYDAAESQRANQVHLSREARTTCKRQEDKSSWEIPARRGRELEGREEVGVARGVTDAEPVREETAEPESAGRASAGVSQARGGIDPRRVTKQVEGRRHKQESLLDPGSIGYAPVARSSRSKTFPESGYSPAQTTGVWNSRGKARYSPDRKAWLTEEGVEAVYPRGKAKYTIFSKGQEVGPARRTKANSGEENPYWRERGNLREAPNTGPHDPVYAEQLPAIGTVASQRKSCVNSSPEECYPFTGLDCEQMQWESTSQEVESSPMDCAICLSDEIESLC